LRLRAYSEPDLGGFVSLMSNVDVNRYVANGAMQRSDAVALFRRIFSIYKERRFAVWAVENRASGEYIGHAELKPRLGQSGLEMIYLLQQSAWGRGLGTELAQLLREHAIRTLGCRRVFATIHPENEASRRVLAKLGFRLVREWMEPGDNVVTCLWAVEAGQ
jgi:RimJ/RimL family protein N-acetyltransferase